MMIAEKGVDIDLVTFNDIVNKMTNHENHLWARAGWPGLVKEEKEKLSPHAQAALRRLEREKQDAIRQS